MHKINIITLNPVIGGQEIYLLNIVQELKKSYEVAIYTKLSVWEGTDLLKYNDVLLKDISYISYDKFLLLRKIILNNSSNNDIFIFNGNRAIYLGAIFPKKYYKIAIQHSSLYDEQDGLGKKILRQSIYSLIILRYKWLIGISQHSIKPFVWHKKVKVILNGVDLNRFFPVAKKRESLKKKCGLTDQDKVILMVGILNDNKGQYEALEILKYLDDSYKMIFVGSGEDENKINNYIKKHHLEEQVFLVGSTTDVSEYYNLADILLFMSKYEGLPLTIIEAMASGIPIVTTNVGGISEVIIDGETGVFIVRENKQEIAIIIDNLFKNRMFMKKLTTNARKVVEKKLSWEKHVSFLKEIIEKDTK